MYKCEIFTSRRSKAVARHKNTTIYSSFGSFQTKAFEAYENSFFQSKITVSVAVVSQLGFIRLHNNSASFLSEDGA